jgi:membrane-associated phospholipid phosphatase
VKHQSMDTSERFGERFGDHRPAVVAFWLIVAGFLTTAAVLILVGLLVTHGPFAGPIGRWDAHVSQWFEHRRTETWNSVTVFGSGLGMTEVIVGLELVAVLVLAVIRRWRDAAFLVLAVTLEASVALATSILVDRPRPSVIRLDDVPPTKSFPSGHTAAAIALYVGLAIILTPHVRNPALRTIIWLLAVLVPVFVGVSRVYRGMHHATDVIGSLILGSLVLGLAWLIVACVACVWRERQDALPGATTVQGNERQPAEVTS